MAKPAPTQDQVAIEAGVLARAMRDAALVIQASNTIPILANVRLMADGDTIELITTDLDTEYRQRLALRQPGRLTITVEARRLKDIAAACDPGAQIALALDGHRLIVKSGRSRWTLPALPAEDFPIMPATQLPDPVSIPGKRLAGTIARVAWSASTELTRYYLGGIFLDPEGGKLRMTTTNGNTLALVTLDMPFPPDAPTVIVPSKFSRLVERLSHDLEDAVQVAWNERIIRASIGPVTLTGKLIEGSFPDYRRVIPPAADPVLFDPATMRAALRRVKLVQDGKTRKVQLGRGDGLVTLSAQGDDGGHCVEELTADCAPSWEAGFNADYLDDMLEAIGGDTIELHHAEAGAPAMFRRAVDDGALGIVMPMRI